MLILKSDDTTAGERKYSEAAATGTERYDLAHNAFCGIVTNRSEIAAIHRMKKK
jgi:hypothetical protein